MSSMEVDPVTVAATATATAAPTSAPAAPTDTAINQTIYVQNLNEKIKVDELKKSLYLVFSQFGNIVEINTRKTYKLRGQAWIIFDQVASGTRALREMQGFAFYGKPMRVSYAKMKSDVVSKADGTFVARPKRKTEEEKKDKKKDTSKSEKNKEPSKKKLKEDTVTTNGTHAAPPPIPPPAPLPRAAEPTPPNNILFVENLPKECTEMMLSMLFQQYQGFQQARLVPGKPGIAFVEFQDPYQSGLAMEALQNFKITANNLMKISFAKK